jgi:2-keto-4-pentenoate hydratase
MKAAALSSRPGRVAPENSGNHLDEAARLLIYHRLNLLPLPPLPPRYRPQSDAQGYLLQAATNRLLSECGMGRIVGYKIGCTSPVMRELLGIPHPCSGALFERSVFHRQATIPGSGFIELGVECEIAVTLRRDLVMEPGGVFTRESVSPYVKNVMTAVEIVDNRYVDYRTIGVPTLIADNFFDCGCVLAHPSSRWANVALGSLRGRVLVNGVEVRQGTGAMLMGHPFEVLAWFANFRAAIGMPPPRRGELVLLGSMVKTKRLAAGDTAEIEVESLGRIQIQVT